MFITTKLTSKGKRQICAALPIKVAVFTVVPFHRETLVSSFVSYNKDKGKKCIPVLKSNKSSLLFRILNQIKQPSFFCLLPQKIKKQQKYLLLASFSLLQNVVISFCILTSGFQEAGLPRLQNAYFTRLERSRGRKTGGEEAEVETVMSDPGN